MNQTMNINASGAIKIHILTAPIFDHAYFQVRSKKMAISKPNGGKSKK